MVKIYIVIFGLIITALPTFIEDKIDDNQKSHFKLKKITALSAIVAIIGILISITTLFLDDAEKNSDLADAKAEKIKAEEKFNLLNKLINRGLIKLDTIQNLTDSSREETKKASTQTINEIKKTYNEIPQNIFCDLKLKINYSESDIIKLDSIFRNLYKKKTSSHIGSQGQLVMWKSEYKDSIYLTLRNLLNGEIRDFRISFTNGITNSKILYYNDRFNIINGRIDSKEKSNLVLYYDSINQHVFINLRGLTLNLRRGLEMNSLTDIYGTKMELQFNQLPYFTSNTSVNEKIKLKYLKPMSAIEVKLYTIAGQQIIIRNINGTDRSIYTKKVINEYWEN
jgi:hypothetical protein